MGQRRARIRCMEVLLLEEGVEGGKFPAALADWTQVKSGQEEEEPDPQDQAMPGQSLGIIQAMSRTYTWRRKL